MITQTPTHCLQHYSGCGGQRTIVTQVSVFHSNLFSDDLLVIRDTSEIAPLGPASGDPHDAAAASSGPLGPASGEPHDAATALLGPLGCEAGEPHDAAAASSVPLGPASGEPHDAAVTSSARPTSSLSYSLPNPNSALTSILWTPSS